MQVKLPFQLTDMFNAAGHPAVRGDLPIRYQGETAPAGAKSV